MLLGALDCSCHSCNFVGNVFKIEPEQGTQIWGIATLRQEMAITENAGRVFTSSRGATGNSVFGVQRLSTDDGSVVWTYLHNNFSGAMLGWIDVLPDGKLWFALQLGGVSLGSADPETAEIRGISAGNIPDFWFRSVQVYVASAQSTDVPSNPFPDGVWSVPSGNVVSIPGPILGSSGIQPWRATSAVVLAPASFGVRDSRRVVQGYMASQMNDPGYGLFRNGQWMLRDVDTAAEHRFPGEYQIVVPWQVALGPSSVACLCSYIDDPLPLPVTPGFSYESWKWAIYIDGAAVEITESATHAFPDIDHLVVPAGTGFTPRTKLYLDPHDQLFIAGSLGPDPVIQKWSGTSVDWTLTLEGAEIERLHGDVNDPTRLFVAGVWTYGGELANLGCIDTTTGQWQWMCPVSGVTTMRDLWIGSDGNLFACG